MGNYARGDIARTYDEVAPTYDLSYSTPRMRGRAKVIDAPQLAITEGCEAVLEIGVGTGRLLGQVRAPLRVGIDISRGMLRHARPDLALCMADGEALPFADSSFDAILSGKGTFRYLEPKRVFAECARVLLPGGRLAVHQFARQTWSLRSQTVVPEHLASPAELDAVAARVGLARVDTHLFRQLRFPPYAVRVPKWGKLWGHCVLIFRKR